MSGARAGPRCAWTLGRGLLRCVLRKPLVVSRIALEGLIIKRTVAAAVRALSSRADGVHRRAARAPRFAISYLSCSQRRARRRAQRCAGASAAVSEQSVAVTVLT